MSGSGGDATSAIGSANDAAHKGFLTLVEKYGMGTADWTKQHYIDVELNHITSDIVKLAGAGHDYGARSTAEFHNGGLITGFGDWGTSGNEGMIHAMLGERIVQPQASSMHGGAIDAMNAGASHSDIAAMYLQAAGVSGSGSSSTHYHDHKHSVSAIDAASFGTFLKQRGGMDEIAKATDKRNNRYAGDAN